MIATTVSNAAATINATGSVGFIPNNCFDTSFGPHLTPGEYQSPNPRQSITAFQHHPLDVAFHDRRPGPSPDPNLSPVRRTTLWAITHRAPTGNSARPAKETHQPGNKRVLFKGTLYLLRIVVTPKPEALGL